MMLELVIFDADVPMAKSRVLIENMTITQSMEIFPMTTTSKISRFH